MISAADRRRMQRIADNAQEAAEEARAAARIVAAIIAAADPDAPRRMLDAPPLDLSDARNAADRAGAAAQAAHIDAEAIAQGQQPPPAPLTGWGYCAVCGSDRLDAETGQCHPCGFDPALPNRRPAEPTR